MANRFDLDEVFRSILGTGNVYFQPPESVKLVYPAIVYARKRIDNKHANDSVYKQDNAYEVTVIDPDPESEISTKISQLPTCRFDRHFKSDNLNHDVYTIYN